MTLAFSIHVDATPEILAKPPPEFAHLNVLYTIFSARVGNVTYPLSAWCDFAGIWLFRWYEAVWNIAERQTRAARLPFFYTYEVWLRRTPKPSWKVSMVERHAGASRSKDATTIIGPEVLVIPEQVEAALLTAIQKLLSGARQAGRWTEDCIAPEALIHDPRGYLQALDSGTISTPHFLTAGFTVPFGRG